MTRDKQPSNHRGSIVVILAILLILTPPLMAATVNINLNTANQTIRGFGGMNFPRWTSGGLTTAQVDTAFGNGPGQIGLTILRIDVPPYSSYWSDEVSAAVRAKSHGAIIIASPWSPPASMKTNGSTTGGELRTDAYDDYADHLTDFANYMSSNGASLYAISLQNEADFLATYESCVWEPAEMRTFLDNNASVIPVKVIAPETVHPKSDWYSALSSASELDIYADHLYGGSPTSFAKEHWMTEHLDTNTDWTSILATGKEIHDCMVNNYSAYIWWYIRRDYGPLNESGNVTKRGYVMSQYAKFVRPGYIRINATANPSYGVYVTAYKSGHTLVIVAINQNSSSSSVTFSVSGAAVSGYTKYETTLSNSVSNQGSVGSTDTLAASSISTYVGTFDDGDISAPEPDPMQWASGGEPAATGSTKITMTAATATDTFPPVQYYFECTTDGDVNSTWQTSATYVLEGLNPGTEYSFRVKARDSSFSQNETDWSTTGSVTTEPSPADIEIVGDWTTGTSHAKESGYSRALIFIAHEESTSGDPALTSVTYGGQTMNKVIETSTIEGTGYGNYVAAFILDQAGIDAATSGTFAPTWNAPTDSVSYASVFLRNVDQVDTIGASDSAGTTSASNPITTDPLSTDDGDMVILGATCGTLGSYTLNNGFTEGTDQSVGSAGHTGVTGYKSATGAAETPSATYVSGPNRQVIIGFVVQAAAAVDEPPAAPTTLAATAGNSLVELDWNDNNELDLDGYNVYRSETSGSGYGKINVSLVADSNYVDSDVNNGTPYYYVVTAVDANANESSNSNEASTTPDYQDCNDVQAGGYGLVSDLNGDCHVDLLDVEIITQYWLHSDCAGLDNCENADMEPDGDVDAADFSDFAIDWMKCNDPQDNGCIQNW